MQLTVVENKTLINCLHFAFKGEYKFSKSIKREINFRL